MSFIAAQAYPARPTADNRRRPPPRSGRIPAWTSANDRDARRRTPTTCCAARSSTRRPPSPSRCGSAASPLADAPDRRLPRPPRPGHVQTYVAHGGRGAGSADRRRRAAARARATSTSADAEHPRRGRGRLRRAGAHAARRARGRRHRARGLARAARRSSPTATIGVDALRRASTCALPAHRLMPVALVAPERHLTVAPVCGARTLAEGRPPMGIACAQQDVAHVYPLPDDPERCLEDFARARRRARPPDGRAPRAPGGVGPALPRAQRRRRLRGDGLSTARRRLRRPAARRRRRDRASASSRSAPSSRAGWPPRTASATRSSSCCAPRRAATRPRCSAGSRAAPRPGAVPRRGRAQRARRCAAPARSRSCAYDSGTALRAAARRTGRTRVAWGIVDRGLPVVQCVDVRREGSVLAGRLGYPAAPQPRRSAARARADRAGAHAATPGRPRVRRLRMRPTSLPRCRRRGCSPPPRPPRAQSVVSTPSDRTLYRTGPSGRFLMDGPWLSALDQSGAATASLPARDERPRAGRAIARPQRLERRRTTATPRSWAASAGTARTSACRRGRALGVVGRALRVGQLPLAGLAQRPPDRRRTAARTCPSRSACRAALLRRGGVNRLVVRVDSRRKQTDFPPSGLSATGRPTGGWWNYGGLLREVYLRRIDDVDVTTVDRAPDLPCATCPATVDYRVTLRNYGDARAPRARDARASARAASASARAIVPARRLRDVHAAHHASAARGCGRRPTPNLYDAPLTVTSGRPHAAALHAARPASARSSVSGDGRMLLNGAPAELPRRRAARGRPPDTGFAIDNAEPRPDSSRWVQGARRDDGPRHYPLHPYFQEQADRLGIMQWSEIPVYSVKTAVPQAASSCAASPRASSRATSTRTATTRRSSSGRSATS